MFPPPACVPILSQNITKTRFSFRAEVDQGKRRSQLLLPFVGSSCYCLPEGTFVPRKSFELVDTVANDSPLWFEVLESGVGKGTPPHAFVDLGCQRGTTIGAKLQRLAPMAPTGVIVQLGNPLIEGCAAWVKAVIRVARGPS